MTYSLRTFILVRVTIVAIVLGLMGAATIGATDKEISSVAARDAVEQAAPKPLNDASVTDESKTVVDLTEVQTISTFSDYWTCVGMVGGQIAFFIITKQFWRVPPWVWPQVRAACWRFIWS